MKDIVKFEQRTDQYLVQYDKAVTALQAAKDELSLDGLQVVDITIEALRARGKIAKDDRAKQAAHELEVEKYRTAAIIAQAIVERDKPTYKAGRYGTEFPLMANGVLMKAGWARDHAVTALRIGRATVPELKALKALKKTRVKLGERDTRHLSHRGQPGGPQAKSDTWSRLYSVNTTGGVRIGLIAAAIQKISAKKLAEEFEDRDEIILARRSVKQVRDWCDEFLKSLPKVRS